HEIGYTYQSTTCLPAGYLVVHLPSLPCRRSQSRSDSFMFIPIVLMAWLPSYVIAADDARFSAAPALAARIDAALAAHWQAEQITAAELCDAPSFLRRVTPDLAGRIPTLSEAQKFAAEANADKRSRAIRRLMTSPDHALHLGRILDEVIQDKRAGDRDFLEYL